MIQHISQGYCRLFESSCLAHFFLCQFVRMIQLRSQCCLRFFHIYCYTITVPNYAVCQCVFHFIIDLGLFCGTTGHQGHLFLKLHVRAGVYFYFSLSLMSRCPDCQVVGVYSRMPPVMAMSALWTMQQCNNAVISKNSRTRGCDF